MSDLASPPTLVRRNFISDTISSVGQGLFGSLVQSFVPVVAHNLGASAFLISLLSVGSFAGNLLAPWITRLIPPERQLRSVVGCWIAGRAAFLLVPLLSSPIGLVIASIYCQFVSQVTSPLTVGLTSRMYPKGSRARLMSRVRLIVSAATLPAGFLAGKALDQWGPGILFPLGALLGVVAALGFSRVRVPAEPSTVKRSDAPIRDILQDRRFAAYIAAWFVWGCGFYMGSPIYPIVMAGRLQLDYTSVALVGLATTAVTMVSYPIWGQVMDRFGPLRPVAIAFLCTAASPIVYLTATAPQHLLLASLFSGIAAGGLEIGGPMGQIRLAPEGRAAEYGAVHGAITAPRGIAAPLIGGALASIPAIGAAPVLALAATLACSGGVMLWLLASRSSEQEVASGALATT